MLTADVSCLPGVVGPNGFVQAFADQLGGIGSGITFFTCDDKRHTMTIDVASGPFTPGALSVNASVGNSTGSSFATIIVELKVS